MENGEWRTPPSGCCCFESRVPRPLLPSLRTLHTRVGAERGRKTRAAVGLATIAAGADGIHRAPQAAACRRTGERPAADRTRARLLRAGAQPRSAAPA